MIFLKIYFSVILTLVLLNWVVMLIRGMNPFKWSNYYEEIGEEESVWFVEINELKKKNGN